MFARVPSSGASRVRRRLKGDQLQAGNPAEVAGVAGTDRVAEFQSTRSDHEIPQRKVDAVGGLLTTDAGNDLSCGSG